MLHVMKITLGALALMLLIILSGCISYGDYTHRQITPLDTTRYAPAEAMYLFFKGEPVDFSYRKIGLVEVTGDRWDDNTTLLNHIKYEAWQHGANAIIHLKTDFAHRESGTTFVENTQEDYQARMFQGLAVRAEIDSAFI